jgi:hypothetical protein
MTSNPRRAKGGERPVQFGLSALFMLTTAAAIAVWLGWPFWKGVVITVIVAAYLAMPGLFILAIAVAAREWHSRSMRRRANPGKGEQQRGRPATHS